MRSDRRSAVALLLSAATALLAAGMWLVPYTPLRKLPVFAQAVAVDKGIAVLLLTAGGCVCIGAAARRAKAVSPWVAGVGLLLVSALFATRVLAQGVGEGSFPDPENTFSAIAWNARGEDSLHVAEQLHPLIVDSGAVIVVLPETGWKSGEIVHADLEALGYGSVVFAPESTATSVILADELARVGRYRIDETTPPWAGVALLPERPSAATPIIVAPHLQQPSPAEVATWRDHVDWVGSLCELSAFVIVLGDMNSTLNNLGGDHLGGCADVAAATGAGATSTWPTFLPGWLGVSIDRFMVGTGYSASESTFRVVTDVEIVETDHWPIQVSFG